MALVLVCGSPGPSAGNVALIVGFGGGLGSPGRLRRKGGCGWRLGLVQVVIATMYKVSLDVDSQSVLTRPPSWLDAPLWSPKAFPIYYILYFMHHKMYSDGPCNSLVLNQRGSTWKARAVPLWYGYPAGRMRPACPLCHACRVCRYGWGWVYRHIQGRIARSRGQPVLTILTWQKVSVATGKHTLPTVTRSLHRHSPPLEGSSQPPEGFRGQVADRELSWDQPRLPVLLVDLAVQKPLNTP